MSVIVLLFALGVVLFFFEILVPGAVLGILGGLAMLGGVVYSFLNYGASGGLLATLAAVGVLGVALWVELRLLPRTRLGRRMFLHSAVVGTSQPPVAPAEVVGRRAETMTPLAPSGFVQLDGRRYEAFSQSGYVEKGATVTIHARDNFRLIVSKS